MDIQSAVELLTFEDAGTNNLRPNNVGTIYNDLGTAAEKKTPEFETFVKKGGWGQDFVQTKILQEIVTRGGGENFACQNVFPIIYPLFNLFSMLFHGIY